MHLSLILLIMSNACLIAPNMRGMELYSKEVVHLAAVLLTDLTAPEISKASDEVKLESSDNQQLTVSRSAVELSRTLKYIIVDLGIEHVIPIPNTTGKQLAELITILTRIHELGSPKDYSSALVDTLDPLFINKPLSEVIELFALSNHLNIEPLFHYLAALITVRLYGSKADPFLLFDDPRSIGSMLKEVLGCLPRDLQQIIELNWARLVLREQRHAARFLYSIDPISRGWKERAEQYSSLGL